MKIFKPRMTRISGGFAARIHCRDFRALLAGAAEKVPASEQRRSSGPGRKLLESDYLSLFFFGLLNPVVKSMRGLCAASHLTHMQQEVCFRPVSPGSFSEAQSVFRKELLREVFLGVVKKNAVPSPRR